MFSIIKLFSRTKLSSRTKLFYRIKTLMKILIKIYGIFFGTVLAIIIAISLSPESLIIVLQILMEKYFRSITKKLL